MPSILVDCRMATSVAASVSIRPSPRSASASGSRSACARSPRRARLLFGGERRGLGPGEQGLRAFGSVPPLGDAAKGRLIGVELGHFPGDGGQFVALAGEAVGCFPRSPLVLAALRSDLGKPLGQDSEFGFAFGEGRLARLATLRRATCRSAMAALAVSRSRSSSSRRTRIA